MCTHYSYCPTYSGGLVGYKASNGTVTNSFYDTTTSGKSDTGKGTGKNTSQMKTSGTFTNWDFNNIWAIDTSGSINGGYPYLNNAPEGHFYESLVTLHNLDDDTDIKVDLTSSDTGEATVYPATLRFNEGNWDTPKTVTVTGRDDTDRDRHQDYKISLSAENQIVDNPEVTTFAGSGSATFANGTGTAASFYFPQGMTSDGTNLYVADTSNHRIRKIVIATKVVSTLAGSGTQGSDDGTGTAASFNKPMGITIYGNSLYVAERYNNKIRKIVISTGKVTTLAGSGIAGSDDGTGTEATFNNPQGITSDGNNIYVASRNGNKIRKIALRGTVTADVALHNLDDDTDVSVYLTSSDTGEATVSPATLTFTENNWNTPRTVTLTGKDDNDSARHQDYNISLSAEDQIVDNPEVTTLAGSSAGSTDATGTSARFNNPQGIITDGTNLYVTDNNNHTIRKIVMATGVVSTFAGSPGSSGSTDATGTSARFNKPK